jgi:sugar/nucleoside kinase (ribokinase family)
MITAVTGSAAAEIGYGMRRLGLQPVVTGPAGDVGAPDLVELAAQEGSFDLVYIGTDEPKSMLSLAEQCRDLGLEFAVDPGHADGPDAIALIEGAKVLVSSEEDYDYLRAATDLDDDAVLDRVRVRVTTMDHNGVEIRGHDMERVHVPAARTGEALDPAGTQSAFRAGFLAAMGWGMSLRRAAEVGGAMASAALEAPGASDYQVEPVGFIRRVEQSYGAAAAAETSAYLGPDT